MMRKAGFFFILLGVATSCSNVSDDSTAPQIVAYQINAERFEPGEMLQVSVSVADDEALNQIRLRIREAFSKSFGFWSLVDIRDVSGREFNTTLTYTVPDSALAGLYEISFQVADERGNGSVDSILQFLVRQPSEEPVVVNFSTDPVIDPDGVLRLIPSDTLTFEGAVSDPDSLQSFSISLRDASGMVIRQIDYPVQDTTFFNLDANPDTVFIESFDSLPVEMLLKARDKPGHQRRISFPVEVN